MNEIFDDKITTERQNVSGINPNSQEYQITEKLVSLQLYMMRNEYLVIYTSLTLGLIVVSFICSMSCFQFCITVSKRLHNAIFKKVISAPMKFFHTNASGRILNRFSKDMGTVDDQLPMPILDALEVIYFNFK